MVTRKGIALTAAIMGGFVAASFLVYLVPTRQSAVVTPTDPETELVFAMDRGQAIVDDFRSTFEMWKDKHLDKDRFNEYADAAANQVKELVMEIRTSNVPDEWSQSYILYIQALEDYRAYVEKTREYVNYASGENADPKQDEELLNAAVEILSKAQSTMQQSLDAIP